jgi:hypothetical protein
MLTRERIGEKKEGRGKQRVEGRRRVVEGREGGA